MRYWLWIYKNDTNHNGEWHDLEADNFEHAKLKLKAEVPDAIGITCVTTDDPRNHNGCIE